MLFMKRPNVYALKTHPKREWSLVIIYQKIFFFVFKLWSGVAVGYFHQLCSRKIVSLSPHTFWFTFLTLLLYSSFKGKFVHLVQEVVLNGQDKM